MAGAVVLLFLLDSLPDFDHVINTTIYNTAPGSFASSCKPTITAPVLEVISKKLNLKPDSVEKLLGIEVPPGNKDQKLKESPDRPKNEKPLLENLNKESNETSLQKNPKSIEHNSTENVTIKQESQNIDIQVQSEIPVINAKTENVSKVDFPETAPFLAAIFETAGNVTAQTCGGVVLSPFLVLTAASCVNVLGPFYSNSSIEKSGTYYSVVIGAKNPLKDGNVQRVSDIYVHPTRSHDLHLDLDHSNEQDSTRKWLSSIVKPDETVSVPSLALLRITQGVEGSLEMMQNKTDWDGVTARLYGWDLKQNESSFAMMTTSMPVTLQNSSECKNQGILESNTTLCLSVNETYTNATKMISGCPVLVVQNGRLEVLAVALADGLKPLLAESLAAHRDWLRKPAHDMV